MPSALPNSPAEGHASRRENASTSSSQSSRNGRTPSHPAVESAVTRLLVAIKQLLEALTQWSQLKVDEDHVSDVYVRLGNDFNAAVSAFAVFNIDMSELLSVPTDLRNVLEQCLAEDATQENLEIYLPQVREIITNLLQGLRGKQSVYRRIVSDSRHRSEQSGSGRERSEHRTSRRRGDSNSHRPQSSRTVNEVDRQGSTSSSTPPPQPEGGGGGERNSISRRSAQSSRRRVTASHEEPFVGGFAVDVQSNGNAEESTGPAQTQPSSHRRQRSQPSALELREPQDASRSAPHSAPLTIPEEPAASPPPPVAAPVAPAFMKRYSLVDKPMSPPAVVVEPSSPKEEPPAEDTTVTGSSANSSPIPPPPPPPPQSPPLDSTQTPAMATSLAALKKSDALERRASKRFSTYNISKMTGAPAPARDKSSRSHPHRRSLAAGSALTLGDLDVLTEEDDPSAARQPSPSRPPLRREGSSSRSRGEINVPPVPAIPGKAKTEQHYPTPETDRQAQPPTIVEEEEEEEEEEGEKGSDDANVPESKNDVGLSPTRFPVFLQLGREVKKVMIEPGLTFASLRVLFVDKFSYNPGLDNFPAIYIRDPSSGVQYELEDVEEVQEKCLLSLNIEPLDQIKQHIDAQITSLSQDIKDLRSAVSTTNRQSFHTIPPSDFNPLAESTPAPNRPTDKQFHNVARRLSRFISTTNDSPSVASPSAEATSPTRTPTQVHQPLFPQMTGASTISEYSSRVVTDLKTQFDEVQNLRRDLGIMRQLYTEFMKQTKDSLGALRSQTQSVKQLASTKIGGARAYIDSGKQKLDLRSQDVLTEVEKLQDAVENIKDDVLKRHITPKVGVLKALKKDIDACSAELDSLKQHMNTIRPMWKKTWEEELQNIVEEQQFLQHQEEFLGDLLDDHKAVEEVYGHVEKIITLRGNGSRSRVVGYRPPPPDEGHEGLSTVMREIRSAAVDPEKRMKAIEASQRNRQQELSSRSDELTAELTDFVGGKKLKMTGGAEETERVRQKKNDLALKAMFNNQHSMTAQPLTATPTGSSAISSLSFASAPASP